jgi:AraC-like DNA-binding protein
MSGTRGQKSRTCEVPSSRWGNRRRVPAIRRPVATASRQSPPLPTGKELLLRQRYRELTRKHLTGIIRRLFREFTGLQFHIFWVPSLPRERSGLSPIGSPLCCRLSGAGSEARTRCLACGRAHLARTLQAVAKGHEFTCRLGVGNFWIPIHVQDAVVGIAYLQTWDEARAASPSRGRAPGGRVRALTGRELLRASRLLRLLAQYLQTLGLADVREADLARARHAIVALESEQTRLRQRLYRKAPAIVPPRLVSGAGSHADQVVDRLLAFLEQNYARPVALKEYARKVAMNAAYLSGLFSRKAGVPFRTYLTELRLEKARELLVSPHQTVSAVAQAIGYQSENRFRVAFKKKTGLSPRSWRETLRLDTTPRAWRKPGK